MSSICTVCLGPITSVRMITVISSVARLLREPPPVAWATIVLAKITTKEIKRDTRMPTPRPSPLSLDKIPAAGLKIIATALSTDWKTERSPYT